MKSSTWAPLMAILIPLLETVTAAWGSTWGWDSDGRLLMQVPVYVVASYALFLAPQALVRFAPFPAYPIKVMTNSAGGRIPDLIWGIYVMVASVVLTHAFSANALWLGSMGSFYLGFVLTLATIIRLLA